MQLRQVITDISTNLPIYQDERDFREILAEKLENYLKLVDQIDQKANNLSDFVFESLKSHVRKIVDGLKKTIDAYYEGKPYDAFRILADFMADAEVELYLDKNNLVDPYTNLYRIRTHESNYALSKDELFHIPFHKREMVSTQRYSIPGLPSLYLANSIFVAWEEMRRPQHELINAVRITNKEYLRLLDLTTDAYGMRGKSSDIFAEVLYKVVAWPLVAACSVKVKNPRSVFKPEYIIPQLLMQWINKTYMDGIKYSSTHIDINRAGHDGTFYNIVLPVKTHDKNTGHCDILCGKLKSTSVVPMGLKQFITHTSTFDGFESVETSVNNDVRDIELFKGHPQAYSRTAFGHLEHILKNFELEDY